MTYKKLDNKKIINLKTELASTYSGKKFANLNRVTISAYLHYSPIPFERVIALFRV